MRKDKVYRSIRVLLKPGVGKAYWDKWLTPRPMTLKQVEHWVDKQIREWNDICSDLPEKQVTLRKLG